VPALALFHQQPHSRGAWVKPLAGALLFLKIGQTAFVQRASKTSKCIDAFRGLYHTGLTPDTQIIGLGNNGKASHLSYFNFRHDEPPCMLWRTVSRHRVSGLRD
jgi:hypothetical protein